MDKARPLVLALERDVDRTNTPAMIQVDEGSLQLANVEIHLPDSEIARDLPEWVIRVPRGNLQLFRCKLIGPEQSAPEPFKGLVWWNGSGDVDSRNAHRCQVAESLLLSSKAGVLLQGCGQRVEFDQTAIAAGTKGITFDLGTGFLGQANVQVALTRTTVAAREACLELKETTSLGWTTDPAVLQTRECAFLTPFAASKGGLFLAQGRAFAQGLLSWQGNADLLDPRLHYILATDKAIPAAQQKLADLVDHVWPIWRYPPKEANLPLLTIPLARTFEVSKPWALDRLVLPRPKTGSWPIDKPPGADMTHLGYNPPKRP